MKDRLRLSTEWNMCQMSVAHEMSVKCQGVVMIYLCLAHKKEV